MKCKHKIPKFVFDHRSSLTGKILWQKMWCKYCPAIIAEVPNLPGELVDQPVSVQ